MAFTWQNTMIATALYITSFGSYGVIPSELVPKGVAGLLECLDCTAGAANGACHADASWRCAATSASFGSATCCAMPCCAAPDGAGDTWLCCESAGNVND